MSDTIDDLRAINALRAAERRVFGVLCPVCREKLPKASPKVLLPGQRCRAHKPHYIDPRPVEMADDEYNAAMAGTGFQRVPADRREMAELYFSKGGVK